MNNNTVAIVCGNHWQIPLKTMLAEIIGNLASLRKYILLVKTLVKSALIHLYNMFMHRFDITLSTCSSHGRISLH